jgi:uncharacterized protein YutE (UPF0331/DUF86 family)
MDERIKDHLKFLNRYTLHLLDAQQLSRDEFLADEIRQASVERFLQMAIESCLKHRESTPFYPPIQEADNTS